MQTLIEIVLAMLIAYLIGSFSSAILICKILGLPDPRTQGSKNPGATNVLRIGGKKAAVIVLFVDLLKGFLPVIAAEWYGINSLGIALTAFAAFLGHLFPIFFRFEGGKGVATFLGCIIALSWPAGLCWAGLWLFIAVLFHYSSLASLMASILSIFFIWYFTHTLSYTAVTTLMTITLIIRHRSNIHRLWLRKESKIFNF